MPVFRHVFRTGQEKQPKTTQEAQPRAVTLHKFDIDKLQIITHMIDTAATVCGNFNEKGQAWGNETNNR